MKERSRMAGLPIGLSLFLRESVYSPFHPIERPFYKIKKSCNQVLIVC